MKRILLFLTACLAALTASAQTAYDFSKLRMENLGRGVIAVRQSPSEVFVTWRYLSEDPSGIKFNVFRDGQRINPRPIGDVTFFVDANPSAAAARYEVRPTSGNGKSGSFTLDRNDEIVKGILTTIGGEIVHQGALDAMKRVH